MTEDDDEEQQYYQANHDALEDMLGEAVNLMFRERPSDLRSFLHAFFTRDPEDYQANEDADALQQRAMEASAGNIETHAAVELSTWSLDRRWHGLEWLLGSPHPRLLDATSAEHTCALDSRRHFPVPGRVASRLDPGTTTSVFEWDYVYKAVDNAPYDRWNNVPRDKIPIDNFCREAEKRGLQLILEEVICARLYTGPMYELSISNAGAHTILV